MLAQKKLSPKLKRTQPFIINPRVIRPTFDIGYEQAREFSQHRNGYHVIYKALHTINLLIKAPASSAMVFGLLQMSPRAGGRAFFISRSSVNSYLSNNKYKLWRKIHKTTPAISPDGRGRRGNLYVAHGLSIEGKGLKCG